MWVCCGSWVGLRSGNVLQSLQERTSGLRNCQTNPERRFSLSPQPFRAASAAVRPFQPGVDVAGEVLAGDAVEPVFEGGAVEPMFELEGEPDPSASAGPPGLPVHAAVLQVH